MREKIISLILALTMLLSCIAFTSCSDMDDDYVEDMSLIKPITLTLYGIKGENMTDEAIEQVQTAINNYTFKKYKTSLELHLYTEEEYDEAMEEVNAKIDEQIKRNEVAEKAASAAAKAAKKAAQALSPEDQKEKKRAQREYEKWAEANMENAESEISVSMDSDVVLDMFLIRGNDEYQKLIEGEKLADLTSYITGSEKLVTKYIHPIFLGVALTNGSYYAIPSNRILGTGEYEGYQYAIRKDLAEKYNLPFKEGENIALTSLEEFFASVKANESCSVLLTPPAEVQNFDFYGDDRLNADGDKDCFWAYGSKNTESKALDNSPVTFVLTKDIDIMTVNPSWMYFFKMSSYRNLGYFSTVDPTTEVNNYFGTSNDIKFFYNSGSDEQKVKEWLSAKAGSTNFAVGIFKGDTDEVKAQLGAKADDYFIYNYKAPKATNKDVMKYSIGVSTTSKYPARSAEIIAALSTDATLRNLMAFGIEDVHYEVNRDGKTITKLNNDWDVDFEAYGNTLLGYIPEELGEDYHEFAKEKNANVKLSAFTGYVSGLSDDDKDALEKISNIIGAHLGELLGGSDNFDALLDSLYVKMGRDEDVLGLYPKETEKDGYMAPYKILTENFVGDFTAFAERRISDRYVPDNTVLSDDEIKARDYAALMEKVNAILETIGEENINKAKELAKDIDGEDKSADITEDIREFELTNDDTVLTTNYPIGTSGIKVVVVYTKAEDIWTLTSADVVNISGQGGNAEE